MKSTYYVVRQMVVKDDGSREYVSPLTWLPLHEAQFPTVKDAVDYLGRVRPEVQSDWVIMKVQPEPLIMALDALRDS